MTGILYGVGVGPGDPELMTLKAVKTVLLCDMIGIPASDAASCTAYRIALQAVPEMAEKPVLAVPIPMTIKRSELDRAYEEGARRMGEQLSAGRHIAFLNLGDPTIYGTYMGLHERVVKAGYTAELVSGVPSFCAVAAALKLPLASGRENLHIMPGFHRAGEAAECDGTRVLMKSAGKLSEVKERLIQLQDEGKLRACAVTNCGMEDQEIFRDIRELDEGAGYFTTVIVKEPRAF